MHFFISDYLFPINMPFYERRQRMTKDQASKLLHAVGDGLDTALSLYANGTAAQVLAQLDNIIKMAEDGTLASARDFCRKFQDSDTLLWLITRFSSGGPMNTVQSSQAHLTLTSAGCSSANAQSILDWFTSLGLSFDTIMAIINAAVALVQGGISWQKILDFLTLVVSKLHPNPTPAPQILP